MRCQVCQELTNVYLLLIYKYATNVCLIYILARYNNIISDQIYKYGPDLYICAILTNMPLIYIHGSFINMDRIWHFAKGWSQGVCGVCRSYRGYCVYVYVCGGYGRIFRPHPSSLHVCAKVLYVHSKLVPYLYVCWIYKSIPCISGPDISHQMD